MAPSLTTTRSTVDDRSLRLVSFGGLAAAVVGSAVALSLSLGIYTPSATDAAGVHDDDATSGSVLTTLVTGERMNILDDRAIEDGYTWNQEEPRLDPGAAS